MAKKNRKRAREDRPKKKRTIIPFIERAFEGLSPEASLVAMREILPLATLPATTTAEHGEQDLIFATILPEMAAAFRRTDGVLLVAIQTLTSSGDASLDVANRVLHGLELEPGETFMDKEQPEAGGPRLQDVIASFGELEIHQQPDFWVTAEDAAKPEIKAALHDAEANAVPSAAIEGLENVYWCRMSREFLRWLRPEPRDRVLDGLARLRAAGKEKWEDGVRLIGAFRAHGLCIPVWELARGTEAEELAAPLAEFSQRLDAAIASAEPLTAEEKRARSGLVARQVTVS